MLGITGSRTIYIIRVMRFFGQDFIVGLLGELQRVALANAIHLFVQPLDAVAVYPE